MPPTPPKIAVKKRLEREGRWHGPGGAEAERDRLMAEFRSAGLSTEEARERCYPILERMFPPVEPEGGFLGYQGDLNDLIDPNYAEPDAGRSDH